MHSRLRSRETINMKQKPIIAAVCGVKNSGKTTLIEKLISGLGARGRHVAVIKHDGHDFHCDIPNTDTYRFTEAGAFGVAAFSKNRAFIHRLGTDDTEADLVSLFPEADVILIEGLKNSSYPKIELVRSAVSDHLVSNREGRFLIVSDLPPAHFEEECVPFEDIDRIIDHILEQRPVIRQDFAHTERQQTNSGQDCDYSMPHDSSSSQIPHNRHEPRSSLNHTGAISMEQQLTHFDEQGQAIMVDVTGKNKTDRTAIAKGRIRVSEPTMQAIINGTAAKGDVLSVARIAGIMAVKRTSDLIPLCHPLPIGKCSVDFKIHEDALEVESICTVSLHGQTGVEMEALTGVSVSLLTIYDMCKAIDKRMEISGIHLARKSGGKSGEFVNDPEYENDHGIDAESAAGTLSGISAKNRTDSFRPCSLSEEMQHD